MSYQVKIEPPAEKRLAKLDRTMRERVIRRFRELAADPFDSRVSKPLKTALRLRSSRLGGWRIIYAADTAGRTVHILSINPRGEAYRWL